jgi:predicted negative regulator of RcsB-dependent stress response
MANHFDLEEQEQLDRLKHFWTQYGNAITWLLILVLGAFAAWNGYQFWERRQAAQASALYDEVERAAGGSDAAMFERALIDLKERHAGSTFAAQAGLLAARY